ncbi:MAG: transcriptional regulator [Planctomycetes bacterium]|nr:transcriptional regulator [Planctomycetota bacterium]
MGDEIRGIPSLDKVIHEKGRLAILSQLKVNSEMSFSELKKSLELSDGNLSVHIKNLEAAGYVSTCKSFRNKRPLTTCQMTRSGSKAFDEYLQSLEALIQHLKEV